MNGSVGIVALFGVIGLIAIAAVYRYFTERRQLASGREVLRDLLTRQGEQLVFSRQVAVSTCGKWCRLRLKLNAESGDATRRALSETYAMVLGTPYTLAISDASGKLLFQEDSSLGRFVGYLCTMGGKSNWSLLKTRYSYRHEGIVTLLEFRPHKTGTYEISLEIQVRAEKETPRASGYWEVLNAELSLREDVEPLSKTVTYPHTRVEL
jgi:hypothetical protein